MAPIVAKPVKRTVFIELTAEPLFNAKPRVHSPKERLALQKWKLEAISSRWIRRSKARNSVDGFFVPKKEAGELRFVVNFIPLNAIIKPMIYAPRLDRALRYGIVASTWYAKIDLKNAFYHLKIAEEDRWKTAFRLPDGVWEWNVLPQGLKNAPGEFQRYLEDVLSEVLGENVVIHIDDILIHTATKRQCIALHEKVRKILAEKGLQISEKKSTPPSTTVEFCGYKYWDGKMIPLTNANSIKHWPEPRNVTQLRSFLGQVLVFRDNLPRHAHLTQPMYKSTGKSWIWTNQQRRAFQDTKDAIVRVLASHRFAPHLEATLKSDASLFACGAMLYQEGRVIAIWSRAFTPAERNYTTNEREMLGVVDSLDAWHFMLEGCPLIRVMTDNEINTATLRPSSTNRRINRWIERLMKYPLTWQHIPGVTNPADFVSRRVDYKKYKGGEVSDTL